MNKSTELEHIHLFGNIEDNFYTLGQRDKIAFSDLHDQVSKLCARNNILAKFLKISAEYSTKFFHKKYAHNLKEIEAYTEGLGRKKEDYIFFLLLPELVASFNKWIPELTSLIPGCSSLFYLDQEEKALIHNRILDYAVSGLFDTNERSILYDFKNHKKIFSYGSAGIPLPCLSSINEDGLSVALHYKHRDFFNLEGESIFLIISEMISECSNIHDAVKFLRKKESMSYWGIYLGDKNAEVASIDICGKDFYQEKFNLNDNHKYLYFNNLPLNKNKETKSDRPFGTINQCQMRHQTTQKKMAKLKESKDIQKDVFKIFSNLEVTKESNHAINWKMSPITPSSVQCISFNNKTFRTFFIPGDAPKFYKGELIEINDIFNTPTQKHHKAKTKDTKKLRGYQRLAKFQRELDRSNIPQAYHEIQMSILDFKNRPEQYICEFYFYILEFIYEVDQRDLSYIYENFKGLEGKLPSYLEDHRILFIQRVATSLGIEHDQISSKIQNKNLRDLYLKESKLNALSIRALKKLIFPRIEILDVLYAY